LAVDEETNVTLQLKNPTRTNSKPQYCRVFA
jgi:hypothetical protein